jgi:hypothetical protein
LILSNIINKQKEYSKDLVVIGSLSPPLIWPPIVLFNPAIKRKTPLTLNCLFLVTVS